MNIGSVVLWGFVATVVMSTIVGLAHGLGLSRMSITFMLGTMFTPNRERAKVIGFAAHVVNGWLFAFVYAAAFEALGSAGWLLGMSFALVHALFVLGAAMPVLPGMHPRMASANQGPTPTRQLQPPGFLALNYGKQTPIVTVVAHLAYGAILGGFYQLA